MSINLLLIFCFVIFIFYIIFKMNKEVKLQEVYLKNKLSKIVEKTEIVNGSKHDLKIYNSIVISVYNLLLEEKSIFLLINKVYEYAKIANRLGRLDLEKRLLHFAQGLDVVASTMTQTDMSLSVLREHAPTWDWKAVKEGIHWNYEGTRNEETVLFLKQDSSDTPSVTSYRENNTGETFYEWAKANI